MINKPSEQTKKTEESTQTKTLLTNTISMENLSYDDISKILSWSNSLLAKFLTKDVFEEYKDKKTSKWVNLLDIIKWWLKRPNSKIWIYAWDHESYTTFEKIFKPIVEQFHWVDENEKYEWELEEIKLSLNIDPKSYIDMRMRMWANLQWNFPSKQTLDDRKQIEREVSNILKTEFWWKYFSAKETHPDQRQERQDKWFWFALEDEYLKDAWIINEFRPEWSWIWMDNPQNPWTIVIVNEEDHLRFTWFWREVQTIYNNVSKIYNELDKKLKFAKHEKYWNLWSCPSNIWHMFKSWIRISFPKLQKEYEIDDLRKIAKEYWCEIRWKWWEMSKSFDVIEVSNSKRFMPAQEAVKNRAELLNRLTEMENNIK